MSTINTFFNKYYKIIISERSWKLFAIISLISFVALVLLDSILVLVKLLLFVSFIGAAVRAVYLAYPKLFKS